MSALNSSNTSAHEIDPTSAARWSGVAPSIDLVYGIRPFFNKSFSLLASFSRTIWWMTVSWKSFISLIPSLAFLLPQFIPSLSAWSEDDEEEKFWFSPVSCDLLLCNFSSPLLPSWLWSYLDCSSLSFSFAFYVLAPIILLVSLPNILCLSSFLWVA